MNALYLHQYRFSVSRRLAASACIVLTLASGQALALDYSVRFNTQLAHESNAARSNPKESDTVTTAGTRIELSEQGRATDLLANYNLNYVDYARNTNSANLRSNGGSKLAWRIVDQIFSWDASHNVTRVTPNKASNVPDTDDNRRTRQELATGPTLNVPLSDLDTITIAGRYSRVFFGAAENEDPNNPAPDPDSETTTGSIGWSHRLSPTSSLNINYQYVETDRDDSQFVQRIETVSGGYNKNLRSSSYSLQIGSNKLNTANINKSDSLFYSANYNANFNNQQVTLSASRQRSDTTTSVEGYSGELIFDGFSLPFTIENFEVAGTVDAKTYAANYQSTLFCSRCDYGIGVNLTQNSYDTLSDNEAISVNANFAHQINTQWSLNLSGQHTRRHFDSTNSGTRTMNSNLSLGWNSSSNIGVSVGVGYDTRRGDLASDNEYDNMRAFISLNYLLLTNN